MKVYISQPMKGLGEDEILKERTRIKEWIENKLGTVDVLGWVSEPPPLEVSGDDIALWYLTKGLSQMVDANIVIFGGGWEEARGCRIEMLAANEYNKLILQAPCFCGCDEKETCCKSKCDGCKK